MNIDDCKLCNHRPGCLLIGIKDAICSCAECLVKGICTSTCGQRKHEFNMAYGKDPSILYKPSSF